MILGVNDCNSLCYLETPKFYEQATDIYKKSILFMITIPEVIIFIFILPYFKRLY